MNLGAIIDRFIEPFAPQWAANRRAARIAFEALNGEWDAADRGRRHGDWQTGLGSETPTMADRLTMVGRSRDTNRNNPVANGITRTFGTNIVGAGLRVQSKMRADVLGISEDKAEALRRQAEEIFNAWCKTADSANRLTFAELQFLAMTKVVEDGDVIAIPAMADEPWRKIRRCVEMIRADRLAFPSNRTSIANGLWNDTGIDVGARGQPIRYWIRKANTIGLGADDFVPIDARDANGRPKVIHVFEAREPGQMRGYPWFAPCLSIFRDLAKYLEAEVVAARVSACLALIFTKKSSPIAAAMGAASGMMQTAPNGEQIRRGSDQRRLQEMFPGMVHYAGEGEEVEAFDPKRPGDTFAPFLETALRLIGASLELPYELTVKDFSKANLSSIRVGLNDARRMFKHRRGWLGDKFCQPFFDLVLEEAYLRGMFEAPRFYELRDEYTRSIWVGQGWDYIDPVKDIQASTMAVDRGLSTLADECAEMGVDWEENLDQRSREIPRERELGIGVVTAPTKPTAPKSIETDRTDEGDDTDDQGEDNQDDPPPGKGADPSEE